MNEVLKLAVAFTAGVVVAYLFLGLINKAEAPTVADLDIPSVTHTDTVDATSTANGPAGTESAPGTTAAPAYTPPSKPATIYPTNAIVSFTGDEMVPSEVVIIEGGSITFVNASLRKSMWIASHAHPLHNAYRETSPDDCAGSTFDQCAEAPPGGSWTFAFNLPGKWYYHEEGERTVTGLVTVLTREQFESRY